MHIFSGLVWRHVPRGGHALYAGWILTRRVGTAFPDSHGTFDNAIASGTTVVLELTWRGTHQGSLQTPKGAIAPTGRPIELRACLVVEIDEGQAKAKLQRHYFDMATLMQQLGVTV